MSRKTAKDDYDMLLTVASRVFFEQAVCCIFDAIGRKSSPPRQNNTLINKSCHHLAESGTPEVLAIITRRRPCQLDGDNAGWIGCNGDGQQLTYKNFSILVAGSESDAHSSLNS